MYKLFCIKCIKKLSINLFFIFEPRINYCILSSICFSRSLLRRPSRIMLITNMLINEQKPKIIMINSFMLSSPYRLFFESRRASHRSHCFLIKVGSSTTFSMFQFVLKCNILQYIEKESRIAKIKNYNYHFQKNSA